MAAAAPASAPPSEGVPPEPVAAAAPAPTLKTPGGPHVACVISVTEGSAGFTCDDSLIITRLDDAGLAEVGGVTIGMRVCQFMGENLPEFRTWTELKKVARVTPKPWTFSFSAPLAEGTPTVSPSFGRDRAASIDKSAIQKKRMEAVMSSLQTLISDDEALLSAELVGRVVSLSHSILYIHAGD